MSLSSLSEKVCPQPLRPLLERVKGSPLARRITAGAFWSVVGGAVAKVFALLAMLLTVQILGKERYGQFGFIHSTALTFVTFSCFGIGTAATKHIAELLHTDRARVGRIIGLCYGFSFVSAFVMAAALWLAAPWLCDNRLQSPHLLVDMRLGAVLLFFVTFMTAQIGVLTGFQDFRGLAATSFIAGACAVPLYAGGAFYGGVRGALTGLLAATLVNAALNSMFIYRNTKRYDIRYSFREAPREMPLLWNFGLPVVICAILFSVSNWMCQLMLASQPNGDSELGIFYAAMIFYTIVLFLPQQVATVFLPLLSELNVTKDVKRYRKTVLWFIVFGLLSSLALALPLVLFSKQVMGFCGVGFETGFLTLIAVSLAAVAFMVGHTANIVVVSQGKMWFMMAYNVAGVTTMLIVSSLLIGNGWGAFGLALGMLAGFLARLAVIGPYALFPIDKTINH